MIVRGFITHKEAEQYSDCQDFFSINVERKSVAVSDGMSQSIFPQLWAKLLANAYANEGFKPTAVDEIKKLRPLWMKFVRNFLETEQKEGKPTWMLENCLAERRGAGATLCGVEFGKEAAYSSYVLGDSCIVKVDVNNNITDFIRSQEGDFGNHPDYFDSMEGGKGEPKIKDDVLDAGGKLLLVTDALSEFLYQKHAVGQEQSYVETLLSIRSHQEFIELVGKWRKEEKMHNDDTTLVIIENDGVSEFKVSLTDDLSDLIDRESEEEGPILPKEEASSTHEVEGNVAEDESYVEQAPDNVTREDNAASLSEKFSKLVDSFSSIIPKKQNKMRKKMNTELEKLKSFVNQLLERIKKLEERIKKLEDGKTPGM
mgnify:CR=1 FL=1